MRDVADAREEAEEGAGGGGTGEAGSAAGTLRNSEGAEPDPEPGAEDGDGDGLEEGAEGVEEDAAAGTSRAANVCGEAFVPGESMVHGCIPWGVRSHEKEIRCATQGVWLRVGGAWALECFLPFVVWSLVVRERAFLSEKRLLWSKTENEGESEGGGGGVTHAHTHLLAFRV
jgi:hypothetical protein